jgi:hypothetical protein
MANAIDTMMTHFEFLRDEMKTGREEPTAQAKLRAKRCNNLVLALQQTYLISMALCGENEEFRDMTAIILWRARERRWRPVALSDDLSAAEANHLLKFRREMYDFARPMPKDGLLYMADESVLH